MMLKEILRVVIMNFFYAFRDRRRKMVFFSTVNNLYSDNQRAISLALHQVAPEIEQYWNSKDPNMPEYIHKVSGKFNVLKTMARSGVWVLDLSFPWKPETVLNIATWHGDRGFKKILYDVPKEQVKFNIDIENSINGMDIFLSGSKFGTNLSRTAMRYSGEIIENGCPRNDRLVKLDYEDVKSVKLNLGIPETTKILLYAPTFRDTSLNNKQPIGINIERTLNLLESNGQSWIILVRAHHTSKGLIVSDSKVVDVSDYPDMADLLLAADILITDYSSCCCDYVLTNRPCVLVQFDSSVYETECRSFIVNPEDTGFIIAHNEDEFESILKGINDIDWSEIAERVNRFYGTKESGTSSMVVAKRIVDWLHK